MIAIESGKSKKEIVNSAKFHNNENRCAAHTKDMGTLNNYL